MCRRCAGGAWRAHLGFMKGQRMVARCVEGAQRVCGWCGWCMESTWRGIEWLLNAQKGPCSGEWRGYRMVGRYPWSVC